MDTHPGLADRPVYPDYNATHPDRPGGRRGDDAVSEHALREPSSSHRYGTAPADAVAVARHQVARLIGGHPEEIVFTGSGSEADNLAIRGAVLAPIADMSRPISHLAACRSGPRT